MEIKISIVINHRDIFPRDYTVTFFKLEKLLSKFTSCAKHEAKGIISGHFSEKGKGKRTEKYLHSKSLLILDVDNYNGSITDLEGIFRRDLGDYRYIVHSTASHVPEVPRLRIVLFFEKVIETCNYKIISTNFIEKELGGDFITALDYDSSITANKIMYLPTKSSETYIEYSCSNEHGKLINPDLYLSTSEIKNKKSNKKNRDSSSSLKKHITGLDTTKIINYLNKYPSYKTTNNEWFRVGQALHHHYEGNSLGLEIWTDWSKCDQRIDEHGNSYQKRLQDIRVRWDSIKHDSDNPITFASVISLANKEVKQTKITMNVPIPIAKEKWIDTRGKYNTPKFTESNFYVFLKEYDVSVKFDVIRKALHISFKGIHQKNISSAITKLELLAELNDLKVQFVRKVINMVAYENQYNSWKEWVESKKWDGVDRFTELYNTVKVKGEDIAVRDLYLGKWFKQLICVTCLNDEEKAKVGRLVLIFKGRQLGGKTSWFRSLVSPGKDHFVSEGRILKTSNSMSVLTCVQHVMVELGEINSTKRISSNDDLKNFISNTKDILDIKYIDVPVEFRRRTVFFGSANEDDFLHDSTGSTRYLAFEALECNTEHNIDMQQFYAQVLEDAKINPVYYLSKEELELQAKMNEPFQNISPLEEMFLDTFDIENTNRDNLYTATRTLEALNFQRSQIKKQLCNEMAKVLDRLKFKRSTKPKGWYLPPLKCYTKF